MDPNADPLHRHDYVTGADFMHRNKKDHSAPSRYYVYVVFQSTIETSNVMCVQVI